MSVDHDIVITRQKIYVWKYDTLVFAVFYVRYQRHRYKCVYYDSWIASNGRRRLCL